MRPRQAGAEKVERRSSETVALTALHVGSLAQLFLATRLYDLVLATGDWLDTLLLSVREIKTYSSLWFGSDVTT